LVTIKEPKISKKASWNSDQSFIWPLVDSLVGYVRQIVVQVDLSNGNRACDDLSPLVDGEAHVLLENFGAAIVNLNCGSLCDNIDII
jgi:hypothetical protein